MSFPTNSEVHFHMIIVSALNANPSHRVLDSSQLWLIVEGDNRPTKHQEPLGYRYFGELDLKFKEHLAPVPENDDSMVLFQ